MWPFAENIRVLVHENAKLLDARRIRPENGRCIWSDIGFQSCDFGFIPAQAKAHLEKGQQREYNLLTPQEGAYQVITRLNQGRRKRSQSWLVSLAIMPNLKQTISIDKRYSLAIEKRLRRNFFDCHHQFLANQDLEQSTSRDNPS